MITVQKLFVIERPIAYKCTMAISLIKYVHSYNALNMALWSRDKRSSEGTAKGVKQWGGGEKLRTGEGIF